MGTTRTDTASRVIAASPQAIYRAFVDPEALVAWLPPEGMTGRIHVFDPREGGMFRMTLTYVVPHDTTSGKTAEHEDTFESRFLELVPGERVVQLVRFDTDDPAFAGAMTMTWSLHPVAGGTEVAILCQDVPEAIRPEDHDAGMRSTLENLAAFLAREAAAPAATPAAGPRS